MIYFFYYLPVGVNVRLRRVPVLTYAYAILCVLIFVLDRYLGRWTPFEFGRLAYYPDDGTLLTAVTTTFLHMGYLHLLGNVAYLVLVGRYVEDRMGPTLFSTVFFGCAAFGTVLQGAFNAYVLHDPGLGVAGASGAVSGILGAFTVRFIMNKLEVAYWVFMPLQAYTRGGRAHIPVIFALAFWFALELTRGLLQAAGYGTQVAYVAHLSGFILGTAIALAAGHLERGRTESLLRRAARHMERGEGYAAQGEYIRYLELRPGDPDAEAGLARALAFTGDTGGAREHYRRSCEALLREKRRGDCEALYQEALRGMPDFCLSPEVQLGLAFGLERNLKPALAAKAYEIFVTRYPAHAESAFALLRAAAVRLSAFSDAKSADSLYERLLREYPHDVWVDFAREQRRRLAPAGE